MNRKKDLWLIIIVCIFQFSCKNNADIPDHHVGLRLELQGKKYEKLVLFTQYPVKEFEPWAAKEFEGITSDGYHWLFIVPDSINQLTDGYNIKVRPFDFQNNRDTLLTFTTKEFPDGKKVKGITLEKKETILRGTYRTKDSESFADVDMGYLLVDTFVMSPTLIYDIYNLEIKEKTEKRSDIELALLYPDFSTFKKEENYDKKLQEWATLVKQYPDSKYFLRQFVDQSTGYKNKNDMKLVFDNFSPYLKNTDTGKSVEVFLLKKIIPVDHIDTLQLRNSKTNRLEPVVSDPSKPTLIVFSASWCGPCHKLIPTLKEIYAEYASSLNMVYISTDKEESVTAWKELMEKEQIPWRSLLAEDKTDGLYEKYAIKGIPFSMIIYKNKETEIYPGNKDELHRLLSDMTGKK